MGDKLTVLLYVDQASRDFYALNRIGEQIQALYQSEVDLRFCSALNARNSFYRFCPDIVLMGNVDIYHGDLARIFHKEGALVFSLPTEQMIVEDHLKIKRITAGHDLGNSSQFLPPALKEVSRFYFWSEDYVRVLNDYDFELFKNRAISTGSPRLVKIAGTPKKINGENLVVGIAMDDCFNFCNNLELMHGYMDYWEGTTIKAGFEGQFAFVNYLNGKMLRVIKYLSQKSNVKVILRPRFSGHSSEFAFLKKHYPNVEIDTNATHEYLFEKTDLFISSYSTMAADALIAGIPTISITSLWKEGIDQLVPYIKGTAPYNLTWEIESIEDLDGYISKRLANDLEVSPEPQKLYEFKCKFYLRADQSEHPTEIIAKDILSVWADKKSQHNRPRVWDVIWYYIKNMRILYNLRVNRFSRRRYYFNYWGK